MPGFSGESGVNDAASVEITVGPSPRFCPAMVSVNDRPFCTPRGCSSLIDGGPAINAVAISGIARASFIAHPPTHPP